MGDLEFVGVLLLLLITVGVAGITLGALLWRK